MDIKEANQLARSRYRQTEKGRIAERRYQQSRKGKATRLQSVLRYRQTEKGKKVKKAADKRYHKKYRQTERGGRIIKLSNRNHFYLMQTNGTGVTSKQWDEILRKYNFRCAYCGVQGNMTMDHVIPVSKGGEHSSSNVVPACAECNSRKGTKHWEPRIFKRIVCF